MLNKSPQWKTLEQYRKKIGSLPMREMFAGDPGRAARFSLKVAGLTLDYSKNRIIDKTLAQLLVLARSRDVEGMCERMWRGEKINKSENRAVLHTALRRPASDSVIVDGEDIMPFIHHTLERMKTFSANVRSGRHKGFTGKKITDVVNIGIGGSDLGPKMVCAALAPFCKDGPQVHFVSNIDGVHLRQTLAALKPESTLFLIASKTFTTQETMVNAQSARDWLLAKLKSPEAVAKHFAALSTNEKAVTNFGIAPENMFPFGTWVGGRFSLWSSIGLSICMAAGFDHFRALLDGAHAMDRHFREAPLEKNMPVIMAMLGIWYRNFWDARAQAILPYSQNLALLPAWMQQLDMESNGKSIDHDGNIVPYATGPVIFGAPGTDGQHSFYQAIHQGTSLIPCDFIGVVDSGHKNDEHHRLLLANMVAQSQALLQGRNLEESGGNPQKVFTGNRPSNTILLERLDPFHLGMLLALYEHKIFVQGVIWNINSFDQWGVELGKVLTQNILSGGAQGADSSTKALLEQTGLKL